MSQRKENSQFDQVCKYINSLAIGAIYTCKELRAKYSNVTSERLGYIHCALMEQSGEHAHRGANVIRRIKRGSYQVLFHIPDFVTANMLEANYGFTRWNEKEKKSEQRGLKWKAGEPDPNVTTEVKASDSNTVTNTNEPETITVYLIREKTVEPINIFAGQLHAYLATADYFEHEQDAWEFLAIKNRTTVALLKAVATYKEKTEEQDTLTKQEDELVNLLDSKLEIYGFKDIVNPKIIYEIIDNEIKKIYMPQHFLITKETQFTSLKKTLQVVAGNNVPWTILAEQLIEAINGNKLAKTLNMEKQITIEDITGKEVYFHENGLVFKGTIKSFEVICSINMEPKITNINVEIISSTDGLAEKGDIENFENIAGLCFSKDEILNEMKEYIDSL